MFTLLQKTVIWNVRNDGIALVFEELMLTLTLFRGRSRCMANTCV